MGCVLMRPNVSLMTTEEISNSSQTVIRGVLSWFVHLQKFTIKPKFLMFGYLW